MREDDVQMERSTRDLNSAAVPYRYDPQELTQRERGKLGTMRVPTALKINPKSLLTASLAKLDFIATDPSRIESNSGLKDDADKPIEADVVVRVETAEEALKVYQAIKGSPYPWGVMGLGAATSAKGWFETHTAALKHDLVGFVAIKLDFGGENADGGKGKLENSQYHEIATGIRFQNMENATVYRDPNTGDVRFESPTGEIVQIDAEGNQFNVESIASGKIEIHKSRNNNASINHRIRVWGGVSPGKINELLEEHLGAGHTTLADLTTFEQVPLAAAIATGSEGPTRVNAEFYVLKLKILDQHGIRVVTGDEALKHIGLNGFAGIILEAEIEIFRDGKEEFALFVPVQGLENEEPFDLEIPQAELETMVREDPRGLRKKLMDLGRVPEEDNPNQDRFIDRLANGWRQFAHVHEGFRAFSKFKFTPAEDYEPAEGEPYPERRLVAAEGEHLMRGHEVITLDNILFCIARLSGEAKELAIEMALEMIETGSLTGLLINGRTDKPSALGELIQGTFNTKTRQAEARVEELKAESDAFLQEDHEWNDALLERVAQMQIDFITAKITAVAVSQMESSPEPGEEKTLLVMLEGLLTQDASVTGDLELAEAVESVEDFTGKELKRPSIISAAIAEAKRIIEYKFPKENNIGSALQQMRAEGRIASSQTRDRFKLITGHGMKAARKVREGTAEYPRTTKVNGPTGSTDTNNTAETVAGAELLLEAQIRFFSKLYEAGFDIFLYGHMLFERGVDPHMRRTFTFVEGGKIGHARQREAADMEAFAQKCLDEYNAEVMGLEGVESIGVDQGEKGMSSTFFKRLLLENPEKAVAIYEPLQSAGTDFNARCPLVMPTHPRQKNPLDTFMQNEQGSFAEFITRKCQLSHRGPEWESIQESLHAYLREHLKLTIYERTFIAESAEQALDASIANLVDEEKGQAHLDLRGGMTIPKPMDPSIVLIVVDNPAMLKNPQLKGVRKILWQEGNEPLSLRERAKTLKGQGPLADAIIYNGRAFGAKGPLGIIVTNTKAILQAKVLEEAGNDTGGILSFSWCNDHPFQSFQTPPMESEAEMLIDMAKAKGHQTTLSRVEVSKKRRAERAYRTLGVGPAQVLTRLIEKADWLNKETVRLQEADPAERIALLSEVQALASEVLQLPEGFQFVPMRSDTNNMALLGRAMCPDLAVAGVHGSFGNRHADMFEPPSQKVIRITTSSGRGFNSEPEKLDELIAAGKTANPREKVVFLITHNETSKGVSNAVRDNDVRGAENICRKIKNACPEATIILDSTSVFPVDTPTWQDADGRVLTDITHFSCQKALGLGTGSHGGIIAPRQLLESLDPTSKLARVIQAQAKGEIDDVRGLLKIREALQEIRKTGGLAAVQQATRNKLQAVLRFVEGHDELSCSVAEIDQSSGMVALNIKTDVHGSQALQAAAEKGVGAAAGYGKLKSHQLRILLPPSLNEAEIIQMLETIGDELAATRGKIAERTFTLAPGAYEAVA
ncbi:MAG: hypothetical protein Q8P27_02535 [Candidatus Peregrinibacteria bacterium]|nr:hypothetical protein [Candidatus Peregrinibacteria bacterium]